MGAGGTSQGWCVEERGKYSSRAGSGSSWAQLLLCAAGAITGVTTQVCSAASTVTGLLLVVFSWERVMFLCLWELYAVFRYIWLLERGWQLSVGCDVSQRGISFCSFAEEALVVQKHHILVAALNSAPVPSDAARNSL